MNVFNKPFDEVTFNDVVEFCKQQHPESTTLDYKQAMPKDLAKHFGTMSNTLGGVIIIGVEEDSSTGLPLKYDGVPNDGKLTERVNQFASNVTPLPSYSVRTTDEVGGKVFVLINVLEGDVPPYAANGDPTIWLRTGNVSTPLRQAERDELVRMVEKKNSAAAIRAKNITSAHETFLAGLEGAEKERQRLLEDFEARGVSHTISKTPHNINNSFLDISIQPFYPGRLLVEPWDLKSNIQDLQIRGRYNAEFPPHDMQPVPNGLYAMKASIHNNIRCYQLYGSGHLAYTEDVWWTNEATSKNIYLAHIASALYRQLLLAKKFYDKYSYSGVLVGEMTLRNALGAHIQVIVPEGYTRWHDDGYLIEKLDEYSWSLELDSHVLHDDELRVDFFKKVMRKVYWDLGIENVSDEVLSKFLEEGGWQ